MPARPRSTLSALFIAIAIGVLYIGAPTWSTTIDIALLLAGTAVLARYIGFISAKFLGLSRSSRIAAVAATVALWCIAASLTVYTRRLWPAIVLALLEAAAVTAIEIRLMKSRR